MFAWKVCPSLIEDHGIIMLTVVKLTIFNSRDLGLWVGLNTDQGFNMVAYVVCYCGGISRCLTTTA